MGDFVDLIETTVYKDPVAIEITRRAGVRKRLRELTNEVKTAEVSTERITGELEWEKIAQLVDSSKLGSGVVTTPKINDTAITAQKMAVHDAAAVNIWVQNAAIQSAKVQSLVFDKLMGGTLQADQILVVGGVRLSNMGISLSDAAAGSDTFQTSNSADWITPRVVTGQLAPSPYAGIGPFNDNTTLERGWIINADGVAGQTKDGVLVLRATSGGQDPNAASTARLRIKSGQPNVSGRLFFKGLADFSSAPLAPAWESGAVTIGGGGGQTFTHGLSVDNAGRIPRYAFFLVRDPADPTHWFPPWQAGNITTEWISDSQIRFTNSATGSRTIRAVVW